jgi:siroheme synthase
VTVAPLAHVAAAAQSGAHESPALLIVGEVAALHATLAWFGGAAAAEVSESA